MLKRFLLAAFLCLAPSLAFAQSTLLQGGGWSSGHFPMYSGSGGQQPIVVDSGPASGGGVGLGINELLQVNRSGNGDTTAPYTSNGTGPLGTHNCFYDAPTTNSTGFHYFCLDADAQGGGLMAYGAGGAASTLPFNFNINGTTYQFPFVVGGIVGPSTSVIGHAACWNNITGTLLSDCGTAVSPSANNAWTGTNSWSNTSTFNGTANFTSTFQIAGVTQHFPTSGNLVGTTDAQTLTNKSISADQINSGILTVTNGGTGTNTSTGTGSTVLSTSPSLTTPSLGAASAVTINKVGITAPATGSTLTIADGKTLTSSNTLTLSGTDGSSVNFGTGGNVHATQIVNVETGALATGSTVIPLDDTIPQNSEGDQYMSLSITPTNVSSTLYIDVTFVGTLNTASLNLIVALFQDSTAGALAADLFAPSANLGGSITFRHKMTAGTTSATTFKVRAGPSGSAVLTFNGINGSRIFGGATASSITITEVAP